MNAMWSEARIKVGHRLAMHVRIDDGFFLRNRTPMVTFTFDDLPKSAVTSGARLLEEFGARGTFYVSGGEVGVDTPDWETGSAADVVDLYRRGHEIGCHTYSHTRACDVGVGALASEIERNRIWFRKLDPDIGTETFAYPFGMGSFTQKYLLKEKFRTCRSIVPGVNTGFVDLQFLRASPLIDRDMDCAGIDRLFDEAESTNGWLIFYGHDVAEKPSLYGCTPDLLRHAIHAATRRKIPVLSMAEALRCTRP
jgi:peptidoglycan/xylan/chitin deacetylase (PgdA/CDA1 family)